MKNSDMPAMPLDIEQAENLYGFIRGNCGEPDGLGLTKREYFAGLAMQGLVNATDANGTWAHDPDCVASSAVDYADALLEALEKSNDQ